MAKRISLFLGSVGSNSGGPERYESELVRNIALLDKKNEYTVFCLNRHGPTKIRITQDNFRFRTFGPNNRVVNMLTSLPLALARQRSDVLHATFIPPLATVHPYIFTLVCSSMFEHPAFFPLAIRLRLVALMQHAVRKAQIIVCVSHHVRNVILERFDIPAERALVVYLAPSKDFAPIPPEVARSIVQTRYGIQGPYLLFSGRWEQRKNVPRILEAFHRFKLETKTPHKLVFTGERTWAAPEADAVIERHQMHNDIVNLGKSPVEELPHLYSGADALVFTSLWEGFGLPIVEAMSAGTPVLTSNNSSMAEIGGDAALLVNPYSIEDMAMGMHSITTNKVLRSMLRKRGLERSAQFTWLNTATQTLAAYDLAGQLGRR